MKKVNLKNKGNVLVVAVLGLFVFITAFMLVRAKIQKQDNLAVGYYGVKSSVTNASTKNTSDTSVINKDSNIESTVAGALMAISDEDPNIVCANSNTKTPSVNLKTNSRPSQNLVVTGIEFSSGLSGVFHPYLSELKNTGGFCGPYSTVLSKINRFGETEIFNSFANKNVPLQKDGQVNLNAMEALVARGGALTQGTQRVSNLVNMYQNVSPGEKARVCTKFQPAKDNSAAVKEACMKIVDNYAGAKQVDCQVGIFVRTGGGHESAIKSVKYDEKKGCVIEVYNSLNQAPPLPANPPTQTITIAAGTPSDGSLNISHPKVTDEKGKPIKYDQATFMCCE